MPNVSCNVKTTDSAWPRRLGWLALMLVALAVGPPPALAAGGSENTGREGAPPHDYTIRRVFLEGNRRTDRDVILRELVFETGDTVTRRQIEESVQRLQNVGVFDEVDYELVEVADSGPDPDYYLLLDLEERWAIIPLFNGAFGGELLQLQVGVYDINLFGRFLQGGVEYTRLGDTNSFSVWFEDPRFLGKRLALGGSLHRSARLRILYDEVGEPEGGYLRERWGTNLSLNREWRWWLRTSAGLGVHVDSFSTKFLSREIVELERERGLPRDHAAMSLSSSLNVGRIDHESYLRDGAAASLFLSYTPPFWFSDLHFVDVVLSGAAFKKLPLNANVGVSLSTGLTTTDAVEHQYFLGGLGSLRGYVDSRFRGNRYWLANAEFRIPSIDTDWFVLQHVVFADAGHAAVGSKAYTDIGGLSVGVGFRIISPKIYNFVARVDWAFPLIGGGRSPLSVGSGQFL